MPPTTQTVSEGPAVNPPTPEGVGADPSSLAGGELRAATQEAAESLRLADAPPPAPEPQSNVPEGSPAPLDPTALPTKYGPADPVSIPVRAADAGFTVPSETLPTAPAAPVAPQAPPAPQPLADAAYPQLPPSEQLYPPLDDAELTRAANATPPEYAALATDKLDAEATPEVQRSNEGLAEVGTVLAEIMNLKNPSLRLRLLSSIRPELQAFIDSIPPAKQ